MEDREERGVILPPPAGGAGRTSPDEVPEDVLAEQDAEERHVRGEPLAPPGVEQMAEELLAEQDADARAAEEAPRQRQTGD